MEEIFNPKSVAVIGASKADTFTQSLVETKVKEKLFLVNPKYEEVHGVRCYRNILDIPQDIGYAIISVPAPQVPKVLDECIQKGVKVAHIYSSGFSETGLEEREELEKGIKEKARGKIRLIGPNCMGIYCPKSGLSFTPRASSESGPVGLVCQSGTFVTHFVEVGKDRNIGFSKAISYGNEVDLDCSDFLEFLAEDPDTKVIAFYVEGARDGRRLRNALDRVAKVKPVIVLKGGVTGDGSRAAFSHTGALAGSPELWEALFRQTGTIQVESFEELMDTVYAYLCLPIPKGNGISIISPSGGYAVVDTDTCVKIGFNLPQFKPETMAELRRIVPIAGTSIKNPLDAWQSFLSGSVLDAIEIVASDGNIHSIIVILYLEGLYGFLTRKLPDQPVEDYLKEGFKRLVETCNHVMVDLQKPVVVCIKQYLFGGVDEKYPRDAQKLLEAGGIPIFPSVERAAKALFNLYRYGQVRLTKVVETSNSDDPKI